MTGRGVAGVCGSGAEEPVEAGRHRVQPRPVGAVDPRGGVGLSLAEGDFAGQQQFPAGKYRLTVGVAFGNAAVVAAPGGVQCPDLAGAEVESLGARGQQHRAVQTRSAPSVVAHDAADLERSALRMTFAQVSPGEVQQFCSAARDRQRQGETIDGVGLLGGRVAGLQIAEGGPATDQALGGELDGDRQGQSGRVVARTDDDPLGAVRVVLRRDLGHDEQGGPRRARTVSDQTGQTHPAGGVFGHDPGDDRLVRHTAHDARHGGRRQVLQQNGAQVTQVGTPVDDPGKPRSSGVENEADPVGPEVADVADGFVDSVGALRWGAGQVERRHQGYRSIPYVGQW